MAADVSGSCQQRSARSITLPAIGIIISAVAVFDIHIEIRPVAIDKAQHDPPRAFSHSRDDRQGDPPMEAGLLDA